jgi:hypothetical protein
MVLTERARVGLSRVNGWLVENWELTLKNYSYVQKYNFYLYREPGHQGLARPIQFYMSGRNAIFDSHSGASLACHTGSAASLLCSLTRQCADIYIMNYHLYQPGFSLPQAYSVPSICSQSETLPATPSGTTASLSVLVSSSSELYGGNTSDNGVCAVGTSSTRQPQEAVYSPQDVPFQPRA